LVGHNFIGGVTTFEVDQVKLQTKPKKKDFFLAPSAQVDVCCFSLRLTLLQFLRKNLLPWFDSSTVDNRILELFGKYPSDPK